MRAARTHDPFAHQGVLLEDERGADGRLVRTATVFLTGRECPWHCVMCDLWHHTIAEDTPRGAIPHQIAEAATWLRAQGEAPCAVKLYNAGSFFDRRAIPDGDRQAIVDALEPFAHVIVESHPALVGDRTWRLQDGLAARGSSLEVAMGLETAHPEALAALDKGITVDRFAQAAADLRAHGVALRVFLLIHPPFIALDDQPAWLGRSIAAAEACGATAIALIPTRPGEPALDAAAHAGRFVAPRLADIEAAAEHARSRSESARVFVDLWDIERFASCPACLPGRRERLRQFNLTRAFEPLPSCACCGEAAA